MLRLVGFVAGRRHHVGLLSSDGKTIGDLTSLNPSLFSSFNSIVHAAETRGTPVEVLIKDGIKRQEPSKLAISTVEQTIPLRPGEVWGAGWTYSKVPGHGVTEKSRGIPYGAPSSGRPELFFKTTALRCVGPGGTVGIRSDSSRTVPEPELGVVLASNGDVVGFTVTNDVSAKDIQAESPLFLSQGKTFTNCCAIGPCVATPEEVPNPANLLIKMKIIRNDTVAFEGKASTTQMVVSPTSLTYYLMKDNRLPTSTVLMTGTGIPLPDDFALCGKDIVEIEIEKIGVLRNIVETL